MGSSPRVKNKLTATTVRNLKQPGMYPDGGGLFLQVTLAATDAAPRKSWVVRFRSPKGKTREMGLGSADHVPLAEARVAADDAKAMARRGVDPIEQRLEQKRALAQPSPSPMTFRKAAEAYIAAHKSGWKNDKHAAQWAATLSAYAHPVFGDVPVADVTVTHVMAVLDPIWTTKTETASRVRGRIESILDWAAVRGHRSAENPARWRGHLQKALPARSKAQPVRHHPALPYADAPDFMRALMRIDAIGAQAFAFCILTATRTNEALRARWEELDTDAGVWTIPATRMKAGREHRVPLAPQALTVLDTVRPFTVASGWVFAGASNDKPLSNMAFTMTLRRMGKSDITPHGFRSTFRDWAAEQTDAPKEVAEAALAHVVGDKVEAAYRRSDLFEKRRALMASWAQFLVPLST